ncbi:MAG: hypothetical protein Q8L84_00005, partial [Hyphomonas sp.]|nr:hypothetical protein [Hyphomonas sp.]
MDTGAKSSFLVNCKNFFFYLIKKKKKFFMTRDGHAATWIRVHNQLSWLIAKSIFFSLKKKKKK